MSLLLRSRAALRREFYRLTGTSESDSALSEHDTEPGSTVADLIQTGLWEAQYFVIAQAAPDRWVARQSVETWQTEGTKRFAALPEDFIRLVGTFDTSALWNTSGDRWGRLIDPRMKEIRGDAYYLENNRLYLTRLATPPRPVEIEYYARHAELTSDDPDEEGGAIDFPLEDRKLIALYAAQEFADHPAFPGDMAKAAKVSRATKRWEDRIRQRGRRSRQPRRVEHTPALGNRFFSRGK